MVGEAEAEVVEPEAEGAEGEAEVVEPEVEATERAGEGEEEVEGEARAETAAKPADSEKAEG